MNEINNLRVLQQQPIFNLEEDPNDDVELGLALLGLSAIQLSRSAKSAFGASSVDETTETKTEKNWDSTWVGNKDWGYVGTTSANGSAFDPNAKKPNFNTKFDPNNIKAMMWQIEQMIAWMKANNMNLNAIPEFLAFFESMGKEWANMSPENRAKMTQMLNGLLSADGQSICKMIIDAMVQGAFYRNGGNIDAARQTAKDLMNLFAGYSYIDNPWFQRFYEAAKWAFEHVGDLKPGITYEEWVIAYEGQWGRFLNKSNGDDWINAFYKMQIAEILKLGNPELIVLMLMMLMVNRDDDAQTALGGLGDLTDRMSGYVEKIRALTAKFRSGNWTAEDAQKFCEGLDKLGFLIDNNPNLDGIKATINGSLGFFLNYNTGNGTIGDLMKKGDWKGIADFMNSQAPGSPFYTGANQALSDIGTAISSISQLTGQTMNTMQGTNQQREGLISAFLKGLTDLMSRINNNSRASRS
ncbi:MAG: hypothetical protein JSR58_06860 [Verrucomicrobia bacterium]|nr:hypothetical protein [Verrucomicrobiota bacterium]